MVLKYFLLERTQTEPFQFMRTLTGTEPKFEIAVEPKSNLNRKNQTVRLPGLDFQMYLFITSLDSFGTSDYE